MSDQQYRVKGAFFENERGGPAYTGFVEIDGVKTKLALWAKTSQAGQQYLQVSEDKKMVGGPVPSGGHAPSRGFTPAARRAPAPPRPHDPPYGRDDMDDDIPF